MVVTQPYSDEDEEECGPGRILTVEEFMERLRDRTDIFGVDKNYRLRKTELIALVMAVLAGMWLTSVKAFKNQSDNYIPDRKGVDMVVTVKPGFVDRIKASFSKPEVPKPTVAENGRKVLRTYFPKAIVNHEVHTEGSGVGSARSRISRIGIIGMLSGYVRGKDVVGGELPGKGGFASGIDAILSGMRQGLKSGNSGLLVRRGLQGIGFAPGYGPSGFNGLSAGGIDDIINNLMAPGVSEAPLSLKTGPPSHLNPSVVVSDGGAKIRGDGRSKSEIMRVVMQNIGALRYAYNRCLREKPGIKGKITIRFAIDEIGNVIHCEVIESSMDDKDLESTVTAKIMRWKFERIDKPGDITEVVYPFVFST
jgi:TonB family protein